MNRYACRLRTRLPQPAALLQRAHALIPALKPRRLPPRCSAGRLLATCLLATCLLAACTATGDAPGATEPFATLEGAVDEAIDPGDLPTRRASECPALDSQLYRLTQDADPLALAAQLGFTVRDGSVQVLIILSGEDTDFLEAFNADIGSQSGNQVQAYVPIDQLCALANSETVTAVRPAAQANP